MVFSKQSIRSYNVGIDHIATVASNGLNEFVSRHLSMYDSNPRSNNHAAYDVAHDDPAAGSYEYLNEEEKHTQHNSSSGLNNDEVGNVLHGSYNNIDFQNDFDDEYDIHHENRKRQIMMSTLFLSLMVLYIGFCVYYRKRKDWNTVGAFGGGNNTDSSESRSRNGTESGAERARRQQSNQAVLDESSNATTRARQNREEQEKLEKRKERIKDAMLIRLIIDDDDYYHKGSDVVEETKGACLEDLDNGEASLLEEGKLNPARQRSSTDDDATVAVTATCSSESNGSGEDVVYSGNDISEDSPIAASEKTPDVTTTTAATGQTTKPTKPSLSSPTSLSCTNLKKYSDAFASLSPTNCSSSVASRSNNSCMGNLVSGSSSHSIQRCMSSIHGSCNEINANSGTTRTNCSCNINIENASGKLDINGNNTIPFSYIVQNYGEECNICLSSFQVGDRAAWKKGSNNEGGCVHAFHEECISRWLLVRNGCPICRRSYCLDQGYLSNGGFGAEEGTLTQTAVSVGEEVPQPEQSQQLPGVIIEEDD